MVLQLLQSFVEASFDPFRYLLLDDRLILWELHPLVSFTSIYGMVWLLHNLVEASFDLFRYLLLGDQLRPWELHPLVSYMVMVSKYYGCGQH